MIAGRGFRNGRGFRSGRGRKELKKAAKVGDKKAEIVQKKESKREKLI